MKRGFLALLMVLALLYGRATTATINDLIFNLNDAYYTATLTGASSKLNLKNVTIPSKVVYNKKTYYVYTIGERAFDGKTLTGTLTVEEGITTISDEAFRNNLLTTVIFPSTLKYLGYNILGNTMSTNIICYATIPPQPLKYGYVSFSDIQKLNSRLYVPEASIGYYQTAWLWEGFKNISSTDSIPPTSISLNVESISIKVGEKAVLTPELQPVYASPTTISWTSSNPEIATVDKDGNITGISFGETIVEARYSSSVKAECKVIVGTTYVAEIINPTPTVSIYTLTGVLVHTGSIADAKLTRGLYLMRYNDKTVKIFIP